MNVEDKVAKILLDINAVCLSPQEPFTWASGMKSPIYTDNRLIMSYPQERQEIESLLAQKIMETYPEVEIIAGTATAGIPHAAFVAAELKLPMIYVRSSAKDHGKGRAIEGLLQAGDKVVLIEDLVSTGRSVLNAAKQIQAEGAQVMGVVSIFNYQLGAGQAAFEAAGIPLHSLTNYTSLLHFATQDGDLQQYRESMADWYQDPQAWSDRHQAQ